MNEQPSKVATIVIIILSLRKVGHREINSVKSIQLGSLILISWSDSPVHAQNHIAILLLTIR